MSSFLAHSSFSSLSLSLSLSLCLSLGPLPFSLRLLVLLLLSPSPSLFPPLSPTTSTPKKTDEEAPISPTPDGAPAPPNQDLPLPRTIISRDALSISSLLAVVSLGGPAAAAAWRFLMCLPTNPEMLEGVRLLQGFRSGEDGGEGAVVEELELGMEPGGGGGGGGDGPEKWRALLGPPGSPRMLYTLQIVDGVLDFVAGSGSGGEGEGGGATGGEGTREWEVRARTDCP